jgi:hypothetical protein
MRQREVSAPIESASGELRGEDALEPVLANTRDEGELLRPFELRTVSHTTKDVRIFPATAISGRRYPLSSLALAITAAKAPGRPVMDARLGCRRNQRHGHDQRCFSFPTLHRSPRSPPAPTKIERRDPAVPTVKAALPVVWRIRARWMSALPLTAAPKRTSLEVRVGP